MAKIIQFYTEEQSFQLCELVRQCWADRFSAPIRPRDSSSRGTTVQRMQTKIVQIFIANHRLKVPAANEEDFGDSFQEDFGDSCQEDFDDGCHNFMKNEKCYAAEVRFLYHE